MLDAVLWYIEIGLAIALVTFQIIIIFNKKGSFNEITEEYIDEAECMNYKWLKTQREL